MCAVSQDPVYADIILGRVLQTQSKLFDLVYDKELPDTVCKIARDTKNPTFLTRERNFGTYQTSQMAYGYGIHEMEHDKPTYARLPIVQSTFYRPSKVPLNSLP